MKTLKLKNNQLDMLIKILDGDLPFTRSRRRKIFVDILITKIKAREEARLALIKKFGKKDDKGEVMLKDNHFEIENMEEFNKEFSVLYTEDVVFDIPPSVEEVLPVIKDLVKNTDIVVKHQEVDMVEDIIKSFDNIA